MFKLLPDIDMTLYPPRKGLEGPFRFVEGVLYYDPKEGAYYDARSDLYFWDIPTMISVDKGEA